jgi:hypothetical protein
MIDREDGTIELETSEVYPTFQLSELTSRTDGSEVNFSWGDFDVRFGLADLDDLATLYLTHDGLLEIESIQEVQYSGSEELWVNYHVKFHGLRTIMRYEGYFFKGFGLVQGHYDQHDA